MDSTYTGANYNLKSQVEALEDTSRKLRKLMYQYNKDDIDKFPKKPSNGILKEHMEYYKELCRIISNDDKTRQLPTIRGAYNLLEEVAEDNIEALKQSYDDEAKVGHKSADTNFYGYTTHIAINEERLITVTVTTGEPRLRRE